MTTPTPEQNAASESAVIKEVRELAAQIVQMSKLGFDPMTIRKGIIGAVSDTSTPPTVSINLSGDQDTLVTQVRTLNNYTPLVGQTVLVAKQGTEVFLLGAISAANPMLVSNPTDNGWKRATLANGAHGPNSSGDVYYRRVLDHGSWKMQWRGAWDPQGATRMVTGLDPDYRPSSRRPTIVSRNALGACCVKMDFQSNGDVDMVGGTEANEAASSSTSFAGDLGVSTGGAGFHQHQEHDGFGTFFDGTHSHGGSTGGHSHSVNSHTHAVIFPDWVSLNGVEYFL